MLLTTGALIGEAYARRGNFAATRLLRSDRPADRKQGAWLAADGKSLRAAKYIGDQLANGDEPDADVREAYIYALGRMRLLAEAMEKTIERDKSGYVRQAAWLALARTDRQRFRSLAQAPPARPHDPWDRIGMAEGWLQNSDVRGVDDLLHWATAGDENQKLVASRALQKALRPMLDIAGLWPIDADVADGRTWPRELVTKVQARCAKLDLQSIVDDSQPHHQRARRVRRNMARLVGARERLRRWLFSG